MNSPEFLTLNSAQDGLGLSLMLLRPEGEVRAIVQIAHGMCENKERYLPFMRYMADKGCLCAINDHRGHGSSVKTADDLGYFYENGDIALVNDLRQISLYLKQQNPGAPLVLLGHSMGSLAVRAYADMYGSEIDALAVCGSPGKNPAAGAGLFLISALKLFFGERHRSKLMETLTTGAFSKRFPDPEHPFTWLSTDMEKVIAYEADPLCGFRFTLNGYRALLKLMQRAYSLSAPPKNPNLPVFFYSGADDPCAPDEKGFRFAVNAMKEAGYSKVSGRMFPGMRHEFLNERGNEALLDTIFSDIFG